MFGAALFYGDAVLTPAISVLSAVEGLEVGTAAFKPYVVPLAVGILIALFAIQRHGTAVVGLLFGPVCALWFVSIGAVGVWNIAKAPAILAGPGSGPRAALRDRRTASRRSSCWARCCSPSPARRRFTRTWAISASARSASPGLVSPPQLVLNYFGQGALLIADPSALDNPFYLAYPGWALYPMVALATAATVIASQATISGAYSMTQQAIQLGYLPRMTIRHTSAQTIGQIYVPAVNWILLVVSPPRWSDSDLVTARLRVRRGRHGHDARHDAPHVLRHPLRLALSAVALRGGHRRFSCWSMRCSSPPRCTRCSTAAGSRSRWARSCSPSW